MSRRYIAGLDIGTTKVALIVARAVGTSTEIIGTALVPSQGMKKGVIVDVEAMADCISEALQSVEAETGLDINSVYIGIAGNHIECMRSNGATGIKGREVTEADLERVLESAATVYIPLDREILHNLPADFIIDGQDGIVKPLGLSGVRLEANVRLITASQSAVENLTKCCERAGLSVMDVVFEGIASAKAVIRTFEQESGVAVVDIGGGTTDVAVFRNGGLTHATVLPVGGNHFTNDIAIGLKVTHQEAERLKRAYGYAAGVPEGPQQMEVTSIDGTRVSMRRVDLGQIIAPRCEEIFELIHEGIRHALRDAETSCVVLTGGTSLLPGIERVAEAKLGIPVRIGVPENVTTIGSRELITNPEFSTGVGLMLHGAESERGVYDELFESVRQRFRNLRKVLFDPSLFSPRRRHAGASAQR